jgi:cell division protein FtsW (lipid II flippase)
VLFVAAMLASTVIILSGSAFAGESLLTVLSIVVGAVVMIGALERFRRRDVLWTSASFVLAGYVAIAWLAVRLPFVQRILSTPRQRFMLWANLYSRNDDPTWWDRSRQVVEALYAFDAGGILGRGLGHGSPFLIPKASSDFIFAAFGEELGFLGAAAIVLAFAVLAAVGLRIARDLGKESFAGLLVAAYTLLIASQAFIHIAGTMNLLPMTGITLPLVSSGMSSLVVAWVMVGAIVGLAARETASADRLTIRRPEGSQPGNNRK